MDERSAADPSRSTSTNVVHHWHGRLPSAAARHRCSTAEHAVVWRTAADRRQCRLLDRASQKLFAAEQYAHTDGAADEQRVFPTAAAKFCATNATDASR